MTAPTSRPRPSAVERRREGAAAMVASSPGWAGPGRKREERKEKEKEGQRAGGEGNGQQAETEEGRGGKGIPFYFFEPIFQIRFQRVFESFWHLGQNQTSQ